ncbi:hypothetical protein A9Q84_12160 [Halobacteriovorax marinus]|uniref:Uncharacterized protein n=1 Tax=Halobacteriovorax marinus TaxID=97084 RepID=A0A1Y5F851_9BACT|nr:hypothetical protein A9Q84_12160 [Halobacteriovorax marinus]
MRLDLKKIKFILSFVLLFAVSSFYLGNQDSIDKILNINIFVFMALIAVHFINYIFLGLVYKSPLEQMGVKLEFREWFGMTSFSNLFNLILPAKAGMALRWFYLLNIFKIDTKTFLLKNTFTTFVGMIAMGVYGLITVSIFNMEKVSQSHYFLGIFILMTLVGLAFLTKLNPMRLTEKKFYSFKVAMKVFILFFLIALLYPIKTYLCFKALGVELSLISTMEISTWMLILGLIPIIPGNMGLKEIIMAQLSTNYGISSEVAVLAILIERVSLWSFVFPVGFISYLSEFLKVKSTNSLGEIISKHIKTIRTMN